MLVGVETGLENVNVDVGVEDPKLPKPEAFGGYFTVKRAHGMN